LHADTELLPGPGRKLTEYNLHNGSSITVCVRMNGGSCEQLTPINGLISVTYDEPDMITLDDSHEARAKMPCGHVIS